MSIERIRSRLLPVTHNNVLCIVQDVGEVV